MYSQFYVFKLNSVLKRCKRVYEIYTYDNKDKSQKYPPGGEAPEGGALYLRGPVDPAGHQGPEGLPPEARHSGPGGASKYLLLLEQRWRPKFARTCNSQGWKDYIPSPSPLKYF